MSGAPTGARRAAPLLMIAAFILGALRAFGLPMTSDPAFHLVRAGNSLLRGSLDAYALPPGGEHAPLLGALVTAFGALFTEDPERKVLVSGGLLLALAAAWLVRTLAAREGVLVGLLGAALLLLPPGLASSFGHRPDAALGGLLLAVAFERALRGDPAVRALTPAWIAVLATPWALFAAVALHVAPGLRGRRSPAAFAPALGAGLVLLALGAALPPGAKGEILRGVLGEIGPSPAALRPSAEAIRVAWGGGLLLLPLALAFGPPATRLPLRFGVPLLASLLAAILLGRPGAFLGATAAFAPTVCLALALVAARFPDRGGFGRRPLVLAFLVPLLMLLAGGDHVARLRGRLRAPAVRDAHIGAFLWRQQDVPGAAAAELTGAIAALSGRVVHPLRDDGSLPQPLPRWVVLASGLLPASPRERALFENPAFLAGYSPWEIRRGRARSREDVLWLRREAPAERPDVAYARALLEAWEARAAGDTASCATRLGDAIAREPAGLGLARESLGLLLEHGDDPAPSGRLLEEARARDATCVLARGHLADRAISAGDIPRADSLVAEAFRAGKDSGELRGLRARLFAEAGWPAEAERESGRAILESPAAGRLLVNHGVLLWRRGATAEAREVWRRAIRFDRAQLLYLGNFERADDGAPAPPLRPIFSDVGFRPPPAPGDGAPAG